MTRASPSGLADPAACFRQNNLDLVRLLAAVQVVFLHAPLHLQLDLFPAGVRWLLLQFPGVPIFFFVSGFLISRSYETNRSLREYGLNRILRIYPGLWVCLVFSIGALVGTGYFHEELVDVSFFIWLLAQSTIAQFFNPDFLRGFGVGVVNGSLWTISVELQFYILTPCLYFVLFRSARIARHVTALLLILVLIFMAANRLYFALQESFGDHLLYRLAGVSFVPWFYMFLLGVLAQRCFNMLHAWLVGRGLMLLGAYLLLMLLATPLNLSLGNSIGPMQFMLLGLTVLSLAYSAPHVSRRLLRGNDISYGIYIYHMPIVNILVEIGRQGAVLDFWVAFFATVLAACASWMLVEKPALQLKRHPMNPLRGSASAPEGR